MFTEHNDFKQHKFSSEPLTPLIWAKPNSIRLLGFFCALCLILFTSWLRPNSYLSMMPNMAHANGPDLIINTQVSNSTPAAGEKFTYLIRYRCASVGENCTSAQISDLVPTELEIVNFTQAGGNVTTATEDESLITWDLETVVDTPGALAAGSSGVLQIEARFPACGDQIPDAGTTVSNVVNFTTSNSNPVASGADVTTPVIEACPEPEEIIEEGFRKTPAGVIFANPGNVHVEYDIFLVDSPEAYVVEDIFPDDVILESLSLSNLVVSGGSVELRCGGTWYDITSTLQDKLNTPSDVHANCTATQALATDKAWWFDNAEGVRLNAPAGYDADEDTALTLFFKFDVNHPVGGILRNVATLYEPAGTDLNGNGTPGEIVPYPADKTIVEPSLMGSIEVDEFIFPGYLGENGDSLLDSNNKLPAYVAANNTNHNNLNLVDYYLAQNDVVWKYRGQLRSDSTIGLNWVNPVMIVDFPAEVDFVQDPEIGNFVQVGIPNKSTINSSHDPYNDENCQTPAITVTPDYEETGRTRLRMDFPGCTIYGGLQQYAGIALYFSGRLKPGYALDTEFTTDFRMYDENGLMFRCFGNDRVYKNWCGTSKTISSSILPTGSYRTLESFVFAKGTLDAEYHRYPELGYTSPNGNVDYEAYVVNTGNVIHRHVDLVSILPHLNDTAITTSEARDSSWEMEFRDEVTVEKLDINTGEWAEVPAEDITRGPYYASSTNPCRLGSGSAELYVDDALAILPSGCDSVPWKPVISDPSGMRSAGLRWIPPGGFAPGEEIRINLAAKQKDDLNACVISHEAFGSGTARADLDPSIQTQLAFDSSGAIDIGSYALVDSLLGTENADGTKWHDVSVDFTLDDTDGRMMVINSTGIVGELYRKTLTGLTVGGDYVVTVWVVNAQDGQAANLPSLRMAVEPDGGGAEVAADTTEPIQVEDSIVWNSYTFGFTANATSMDFVLSTAE